MNRLEIIAKELEAINPRNDWMIFLAQLDAAGYCIIQKPDEGLLRTQREMIARRNEIRRELENAETVSI
jgi:hypothetical protein